VKVFSAAGSSQVTALLGATGCHRLRREVRGKQGVCRGLPPVAGGPLPVKDGVEAVRRRRLSLSVAVRAGTQVASATGARLSNHDPILSLPRCV